MPDDDFRERLAKNLVEQKDVLAALAMPDATHGVPVWRIVVRGEVDYYTTDPRLIERDDAEPGIWYPADEAADIEAVVEACRRERATSGLEWLAARDAIYEALDRLDAIRGAA